MNPRIITENGQYEKTSGGHIIKGLKRVQLDGKKGTWGQSLELHCKI